MDLRVGCEFTYESLGPTPAVVLVEPHLTPPHQIAWEEWSVSPEMPQHTYHDSFQNTIRRLVLPTGTSTLRYDAIVEVSGEPDTVAVDARQSPIEELPDDVVVYTLASRYCQSEALSQVAWHLFGKTEPGWARVQAVCDWLHANIQYGKILSTPTTTAVDVYVAGGGMCRDFAHLAITFCRALNVPARYVFGYMPDIAVHGALPAMDFHAWFEVWLDDRWWTFDARFNFPRIGRIPVGIGRDAVDVAMVTTWGAAQFRSMVVWADVHRPGEDQPDPRDDADAVPPEESEGITIANTSPQEQSLT
ncbi:MAG TPA: transglutaminase family protein [Thermomicrobiales bacterium]|nr:transglutaminase family protein [Thermomicrobiales bacterium]